MNANQTGEGFNLFQYHNVFALSLEKIQNLLASSDPQAMELAKRIIIFNIVYASALNGTEHDIRLLMKLDIYKLIKIMVREQKRAGLIPVQKTFSPASIFQQILYSEGEEGEVEEE